MASVLFGYLGYALSNFYKGFHKHTNKKQERSPIVSEACLGELQKAKDDLNKALEFSRSNLWAQVEKLE